MAPAHCGDDSSINTYGIDIFGSFGFGLSGTVPDGSRVKMDAMRW